MNNASINRFTLLERHWYATEFIGDEFGTMFNERNSPIFVESLIPASNGSRKFELHFYHANYPEGVRQKIYTLQTIERGEHFLLTRCVDHVPARLLHFFNIDWEWLSSRFTIETPVEPPPIAEWLSSNWMRR
jgi:hypothetical protein